MISYPRASRPNDAMRPISIATNVNKHAEGSCLIKCGDTHVLCTATVETKLPGWLKGQNIGWVTAEYGMLPRATDTRAERETKKGPSGRTLEIQRLIGRALRAVVDLRALDDICVKIDCDVLQADGGTRTASITGGYVALALALKSIRKTNALTGQVAAVSAGIVGRQARLDLEYEEDSHAETDANFVLTAAGDIVEIQATAERHTFSEAEFLQLLGMARKGISELLAAQNAALA